MKYQITIYGKPFGEAADEETIAARLEHLKWSVLGIGMEEVKRGRANA